MALKHFKPTTPSRRHFVRISRKGVAKKSVAPKKLRVKHRVVTGRNNQGRITVRHRGGTVKRKYRIIDFKRDKFDITAVVESIEYDPNRTANIALLRYEDGERRYILCPADLKIGDKVVSSKKEVPVEVGNSTVLKNIPTGILIHNIEMYPGRGGILGRSAGAKIKVMGLSGKYMQLKMPSGEVRLVNAKSMATIGVVSNEDHMHERLGKAGVSRKKGIRPAVRGVVMGAHDHPHGGGEGRTGTGRPAKDIWGHRVGTRTRHNKRTEKFIIKKRWQKRR